MSDDMRSQLTDFAAEFMAEAEAELGYPKKQEIMNNW